MGHEKWRILSGGLTQNHVGVEQVSSVTKRRLTPQEYLAIERSADHKSEYFDGEMFAMAGAKRWHNLIAGNVAKRLGLQLDDRKCEVHASDMRVKVSPTGLYTYPDIVVVCHDPFSKTPNKTPWSTPRC
jgi:Uma2 family endonuclease